MLCFEINSKSIMKDCMYRADVHHNKYVFLHILYAICICLINLHSYVELFFFNPIWWVHVFLIISGSGSFPVIFV